MAARQIIVPGAMPSRDANGRALPAKFRFFVPAAALTTPKPVYTSSALTTPHPPDITSDAAGRWPQIWADDAEAFDVGWYRLDNGATIKTFLDVRPADDAVLASVALADAAADAAEEARDQTQAIADKFGDVDAAVTAAQQAATNAGQHATDADEAKDAAVTAQGLAEQAQAAAEQAKEDAEAIVGIDDPSKLVRVDVAQAFTDPQKAQGRANIGAQPFMQEKIREKVARPAIGGGGVLTLDYNAASIFEVQWTASITSVVIQNLPADTDSTTIGLILVAAGGTGFTPGAVFKTQAGAALTLSTTAGDYNFLTLTTRNGGTRIDVFNAGYTR